MRSLATRYGIRQVLVVSRSRLLLPGPLILLPEEQIANQDGGDYSGKVSE